MRASAAAIPTLFALLAVGGAPAPARAADTVGFVRSAEGAGVVRRDGQDLPARVGLPLAEGDAISTPADGRLGVLFLDDTRVGLGPATDVQIVRFRFEPKRDDLAFVLRVVRGAVAYVSGKIAALGPGQVRIETPAGVVGVRGTALAIRTEGD
jgi:hypothetical protein